MARNLPVSLTLPAQQSLGCGESLRNLKFPYRSRFQWLPPGDLVSVTLPHFFVSQFLTRYFLITAAADVTKLLKDAGVEADKDSVKTLISKLDGQNLPELIAAGYDKFAAVGGGGAAAAPAGGDAGAGAAPAEEKKKEEEPEEEVDMGNMFGDDDDY